MNINKHIRYWAKLINESTETEDAIQFIDQYAISKGYKFGVTLCIEDEDEKKKYPKLLEEQGVTFDNLEDAINALESLDEPLRDIRFYKIVSDYHDLYDEDEIIEQSEKLAYKAIQNVKNNITQSVDMFRNQDTYEDFVEFLKKERKYDTDGDFVFIGDDNGEYEIGIGFITK